MASQPQPRPQPRRHVRRASSQCSGRHHPSSDYFFQVTDEQPPPPHTLERGSVSHSHRRWSGSCSNISISERPLVVYEPPSIGGDPMAMGYYGGAGGFPFPPQYWFPPPPLPMPAAAYMGYPPQVMDFETFRRAMKESTRLEKKKMRGEKEPSVVMDFCCGGMAQLLWTIVGITAFGFILALLAAMFIV